MGVSRLLRIRKVAPVSGLRVAISALLSFALPLGSSVSAVRASHAPTAVQQNNDSGRSAEVERKLKSVESGSDAGAWRRVAVDVLSQQDNVSSRERGARNEYWAHHLPSPGGNGPFGLFSGDSPELLPDAKSLWIVANFESFTVFEPEPGAGAYTDIRMVVIGVLGNRTTAKIEKDTRLDVGEPGGSIKTVDGGEHRYNLNLTPYTLQPLHAYLLQLLYFPDGSFFRIERCWDLSSGIAIPLGIVEVNRYRSGGTFIGGRPSADAVMFARAILNHQIVQ